MKKDEGNYVNIWGDHVNIRDLGISMTLCVILSLVGFMWAPGDIEPLITGLAGGIVGFMISSIIIRPKRNIIEIGKEE